jgi:hypothetical protein
MHGLSPGTPAGDKTTTPDSAPRAPGRGRRGHGRKIQCVAKTPRVLGAARGASGRLSFLCAGPGSEHIRFMVEAPRVPVLAVSALLALLSPFASGCSSRRAPPLSPPPAAAQAVLPPAPVVPPGHLARTEVDRVLVTQGPPWVLRRVMTEEVLRSDGKFTGWRMAGLPEEWKDIDLKPGDVVTRVNGLPLETPDDAWEAWKSVAKFPELKVTLTRDGTTRTLVLPIDGPILAATAAALGKDAGPQRAAAAPETPGRTLGGGVIEPDQEAY